MVLVTLGEMRQSFDQDRVMRQKHFPICCFRVMTVSNKPCEPQKFVKIIIFAVSAQHASYKVNEVLQLQGKTGLGGSFEYKAA
jgi:hypothetical protein